MIVVTAMFGPSFKGSVADFKRFSAEILAIALRGKNTRYRSSDVAYIVHKGKARSITIDVRLEITFQSRMNENDRLERQVLINKWLQAMFPELRLSAELSKDLEVFTAKRSRTWESDDSAMEKVIAGLREDLALKEAQACKPARVRTLVPKSRQRVTEKIVKTGTPEAIAELAVLI